MRVIFYNTKREEEVVLERIRDCGDSVEFQMIIKHDPFYVKSSVSFSNKAIISFCDHLAELKAFRSSKATLSSLDIDLSLSLVLDAKTGIIEIVVSVYKGTKGHLHFEFLMDQSFIDELILQLKETLGTPANLRV